MYYSTSSSTRNYGAVVVGGGPAGITVLGNLLEQHANLPAQRLLWVDPHFRAGRVNSRYREVPSNTAVRLFIQFAEAVPAFRTILEKTSQPNAITALRDLPQDKGCELSKAADMCLMLTDGLARNDNVQQQMGKVTHAVLDKQTNHWTLTLSDAAPLTTPHLVLCTGSSPITTPLPILATLPTPPRPLHLDTALTPSILATHLPATAPTTVAVIGSSHSAILVLMNLSTLAASSHPHLRIKWFTRSPLRYAQHMPDGWILRDNTGLKGAAAAWARANLEDEVFANSPVAKFLTKYNTPRGGEAEDAIYAQELPGCSHIVQAVGYARDALPELAVREGDGAKPERLDVLYDNLSGRFVRSVPVGSAATSAASSSAAGEEEKEFVPGLFGAGIAFPERVTDPFGNVEYAVGFWKFMKFVKRVAPEWVGKA